MLEHCPGFTSNVHWEPWCHPATLSYSQAAPIFCSHVETCSLEHSLGNLQAPQWSGKWKGISFYMGAELLPKTNKVKEYKMELTQGADTYSDTKWRRSWTEISTGKKTLTSQMKTLGWKANSVLHLLELCLLAHLHLTVFDPSWSICLISAGSPFLSLALHRQKVDARQR